jgi:hypothetical protein
MELWFTEVTIIMQDSEKSGPCGDVDLFLTGVILTCCQIRSDLCRVFDFLSNFLRC